MSIDVQQVLEEKMKKSISVLKEELNTVRAGRANPALLDQIKVDYYGSPTPLKNISNISVPDPRTLMISPFDPKSIHDIEKAINVANLGINPSNDGKVIRLVIPAVTEERRKELIKVIKKYGEDAKVAVRKRRKPAAFRGCGLSAPPPRYRGRHGGAGGAGAHVAPQHAAGGRHGRGPLAGPLTVPFTRSGPSPGRHDS
jgi:ribosome recycling factor